jgi:hypothetical protein
MALARKEENPIAYLFKPEYAGHADTIYGELMANKWDKVLEFSPVTDIAKMLYFGAKDGGYRVTINCANEIEEKAVKKYTNMWSTKINVEDVSKYQVLYIYYIEDIIRRKWNVDAKSVYLYDWAKNHINDDIKESEAINPLAFRWVGETIFTFIKPYASFELPNG